MGANAQTSVPTFTAGEVLTAANMNISARTGVPVFADTTARDAGFGGTGEKTLAEGQLCYLESTNVVQYYDGAVWATVGPTTVSSALTLISSTTIGSAVSTVTVSNAFSSTYDNYLIVVSGGVGSATSYLLLTLGATATGYYRTVLEWSYGGSSVSSSSDGNTTSGFIGGGTTNSLDGVCMILAPNLAKVTSWTSTINRTATTAAVRLAYNFLNDTTQYTAFTVAPSTGTITGGTIKVYGYANS